MNKLILLFASLAIMACSNSVEPELKENNLPASVQEVAEDQDLSIAPNLCDRVEVHTIVVDGQTLVFKIPALCDPNPIIDRGDPPDILNPNRWTEIIATPSAVSPLL